MLIFYEQETDERARIMMVHNRPEELDPETRERGIDVQNIPEPEVRKGKRALPYINPKTGEIWYEYVDREMTETELLEEVLERLDSLENKIDALSSNDDAVIRQ